MQNEQNNEKNINIFDNPISLSIIIAAFVVAISVIAGAYMLRGGSLGAANAIAANPSGVPGTNAPVKVTDRADQPTIGSANAKLTIYEFGDFQCPYCKQFYTQSFADIKTKYIDTGKIKLVFRHFPLTQIHVNAQISSEAAECANRQGRFDDFYNTLYTKGQGNGTGLDAASLKGYASQLGLNMAQFNECLDNHQAKSVVDADAAAGAAIGVQGTPSFVIAGQLVVGALPTAAIEQSIDQALAK